MMNGNFPPFELTLQVLFVLFMTMAEDGQGFCSFFLFVSLTQNFIRMPYLSRQRRAGQWQTTGWG